MAGVWNVRNRNRSYGDERSGRLTPPGWLVTGEKIWKGFNKWRPAGPAAYDGVMQVTVFGANGRVGRLVVTELLRRGHRVTAFTHRHAELPADDRLQIVQGDIHDLVTVQRALVGSQAVISALGSWGTPSKDIVSGGMQAIIPAAENEGISRLVSLTGSEARLAGDELTLIHRLAHAAASLLAGRILRDGEAHLRLLSQSRLDWTVLRSPVMNTWGSSNFRVVTGRPLPWTTIHRQAVATALVNQLDDFSHNRTSPFIGRA